MSNRTIKYEIKLQKSVIIILGILAVGVSAIAFSPIFSVKKADAAFGVGSDGMIISMERPYIWHLKEGQVRGCYFNGTGHPIKCTDWKE